MTSFVERVRQAQAKVTRRDSDPLREKVEEVVRCVGDSVSTAALLEMLGLPTTTGNARRISKTMRLLGFVPIKSRRLMPGGYHDTVTRGWTRPVRSKGNQVRLSHLEVQRCNQMDRRAEAFNVQ